MIQSAKVIYTHKKYEVTIKMWEKKGIVEKKKLNEIPPLLENF